MPADVDWSAAWGVRKAGWCAKVVFLRSIAMSVYPSDVGVFRNVCGVSVQLRGRFRESSLRLLMAGETPPTSLCHVCHAQCIILLCIAIAAGVAQVDASVQPAGEAAQGNYDSALQAAIAGDAATLRMHAGAVQRGKGSGGGQDGREPIHESARRGHVDAVQALVQRGADLNAVDQMGRTALMDAAWEGHPAVVKALLEAGADATIENAGGGTALKVAMRKKGDPEAQGEVIRLLREHLAQRPEDGRPREEKLKWHGDPDWKWNGGQGVEL